MAVALSLLLGGEVADAVRRLWTSLADAGESRDMLELGYSPHLTLLVAEDEGRAAQLVDALRALAPLVPATLVLGEVRQFAGSSVTWVSVVGDRAGLDRLHAAAARSIDAEAVRPHYRPGAWIPHVTLATEGTAPSLLEHARGRWRPGGLAPIVRLEVARFPPAEAIAGIDLPPK